MKSYRSLDHMLKRPLNFIIQKGDLSIQLKYITRLRIFLVLSVAQVYNKTKDFSSLKCRKVEKNTKVSIGFIVL